MFAARWSGGADALRALMLLPLAFMLPRVFFFLMPPIDYDAFDCCCRAAITPLSCISIATLRCYAAT